MSTFGGLILTNKGRNLQAKVQAGAELHYTRIGVGDGSLGGGSILVLNALIHQVVSLNITKLRVLSGGKAVVGSILSNQGLEAGFYWREFGVFALDPDIGEVLYCYGNAGALAEYIPAGGGPDIVEKSIDAITIVGNAANVTAAIDENLVYATQEDILFLQGQIDSKETPSGAQDKADTAQANAIAAAESDATSKANSAESSANAYTDSAVGALAGPGNTKTVKQLDDAHTAHLAENLNYKRVTSMGGMA